MIKRFKEFASNKKKKFKKRATIIKVGEKSESEADIEKAKKKLRTKL